MPRPFRFLAEARDIASVQQLTETIRRSKAVDGVDEMAPVTERLAGTWGP